MAKVNFKRYETDLEAEESDFVDGNFITTKEGSIYFDYEDERVQVKGGGSGSSDIVVIGDETEATEDTKLIIEEDDMNLDLQGSDFLNEYSESTEKGYSCDYLNNNQANAKILWENPNPTSSFGTQDITLNSDDYDMLLWLFSTNNVNSQYISVITIKGKGLYVSWVYNNGFVAREINYVNSTTYSVGDNKSNGTTLNINTIPQIVIGYKTGLFS